MVTQKEKIMHASQTQDSLSVDTREVARVAWEQAVQADQKLDEIKVLIEAGDFDRAIAEMSEFVGAKKPARRASYEGIKQGERAG